MNIGINATYAVSEEITGVGNYILNLVTNLINIDNENKYYLFYKFPKIKKEKYLKITGNNIPFISHLEFLIFKKIDIFHNPSFNYIKIGKSKTVVTIHDVVSILPLDFTSTHSKKTGEKKISKALKKADYIIAVSNFTKNQIIKYFNINNEKIKVVYNGLDKFVFNTKLSKNSKEEYILFVGNIEKRKNLINLIHSFNTVKKKYKALKLLLIGKDGYGADEINNLILKSNGVVKLGYVENEKLVSFYRNALLFIYPSVYEGFGLPILEAQACGVPVIVSDIPVFKEVAGNGALFVGTEIEDITEGILFLIEDKNKQNQLIKRGFENIKRFDWEKTARETLEVYKECK